MFLSLIDKKSNFMENLLNELTLNIRKELPYLDTVSIGQRFYSKYYGLIVATRIKDWGGGIYSIYGFDQENGSPRDNYYPRDLTLLGKNITLSDVLLWHSYKKRNKYSHFEIINSVGYFVCYDNDDETYKVKWDLSKNLLENQNDELIMFLYDLI